MTRCLAVNTANALMSVVVMEDDAVLHAWQSDEMRDQGNLLLQHAGAALGAAGLSYADLDLLAVVTGPGSFTGIRIGLAAMRGLAMAAGLPLAGVSSFELFAAPPSEGLFNPVAVESWREELYFCAFDAAGAEAIAPVNETPEDFAARLKEQGMDPAACTVSGDAAEKLIPLLPGATLQPGPATAEAAARVALKRLKEQGIDAFATRPGPFYLRPPDVTVSSKK